MKLYKKNKDQVEVTKRTENNEVVIVKTEKGTIRLLLKFQPLFDIEGNLVTDFLDLPIELKAIGGLTIKNKDSKIAMYISEVNDHKTFNHLTKKYN